MTLALWVNQDTPQHTAAVELRRRADAYGTAQRVHLLSVEKWQEAALRILPRPSCRELRALFFDMQDAEAARDLAFTEWSRAFDAVRGEGL